MSNTSQNSNSWGNVAQQLNKDKLRKSPFRRLSPGERAELVVVGDPAVKEMHWNQTGSTNPCVAALGPCPYCMDGNAPRISVAIGVIDVDLLDRVRTMEASPTLFNQLAALLEEYPLEDYAFTISRAGSGMDTRYTVESSQRLTADQKVQIASIPVPDIGREIADAVAKHNAVVNEIDDNYEEASHYNTMEEIDDPTAVANSNQTNAVQEEDPFA